MATALGFQGFLHTGERRGGRYGCHVAETRQACRSPSRNFISGRNAPLLPSFSPLRFRSSMRERKSFLRRFDAT